MFAKNLLFYTGQGQASYIIILEQDHRGIPCKFPKKIEINPFLPLSSSGNFPDYTREISNTLTDCLQLTVMLLRYTY